MSWRKPTHFLLWKDYAAPFYMMISWYHFLRIPIRMERGTEAVVLGGRMKCKKMKSTFGGWNPALRDEIRPRRMKSLFAKLQKGIWQALHLCSRMLFYLAICLLSQTRYIFAHAQMRYNLPCGRLRYDINPFTPERAYRIEDISHAARVYRKSHKGFISLRSVLKGTTLKGRTLKDSF